MSVQVTQRKGTFCRFNLRGMCRFGARCRNLHISAANVETTPPPESEKKQGTTRGTTPTSSMAASLGACALSPKKAKETESNKESRFGPSTSSVGEAVALVKKAQSEDKTCGICFDNIMQKINRTEQNFGILPNCNHCFCFTCITTWRQSKEFELDVSKACPECRITSDFVYRSKFWVDNKEEKEEFIETHKQRMRKTDCKYFRKGKGKCPFGNTCLYLHALPNGERMDVGPPQPWRHRPTDNDLVHQILFWLNYTDLGEDHFDLDLPDPFIAMQYDHGDIRRYVAMNRLMGGDSDDDDDDSDYDLLFA